MCTEKNTHTFLIIMNSMEPSPWETNKVTQAVKILPAFYKTLMFITALTRACKKSLSCARQIQSIPSHKIS